MSRILLVMSVFAGCISAGSFSRMFPTPEPWFYSPMDVCQLESGLFAMTQAGVMEDAVLFLLDADGNLVFEQSHLSVRGRALESGGWILPVADGGCFVCAYSEPRATGVNSDIALFKLSADGEIEWNSMIGEDSDVPYSGMGAAASVDGGCAVIGTSNYGYEDAFMRMYSPSGSVEWEINFQDHENCYPVSAYYARGGFLVLLGHEWEETAVVLRLDDNGCTEWATEIPYGCRLGPSAFAEFPGGYRVYFSDKVNRTSGVSVSIDGEGEILEAVQFSHGIDVFDALITDTGSIVVAGSWRADGEEAALVKAFSFQGEPLWSRRMNSSGEDLFTAVCQCSDGGYCLLGSMNPMNDDDPCGIVFVKTGSEGIAEDSEDTSVIPVPVDIIEAPSLCIGWVIACGVYGTESEAFDRAQEVYSEIQAGMPEALWIPDWGSLSGYEGWLGCVSCTPGEGLTDEQMSVVLAICPDSYMVWVGTYPIPDGRMSLGDYN